MFRKETKLYVLLVRGFLLFTLVASLPLHSQDTGGGFNDISPAGDAELDTINPAGAGDDTPVTPPAISPGDSTKAKANWSNALKKASSSESWQSGMKEFRPDAGDVIQSTLEKDRAEKAKTSEIQEKNRLQTFKEDQAAITKNQAEMAKNQTEMTKSQADSARNTINKLKGTDKKSNTWMTTSKKEKERMDKSWSGESAECQQLKRGLNSAGMRAAPQTLESPFKSEAAGKLANKRLGHPYTPKFQGSMLFQECQGFVPQDWDQVVANKGSGPENFIGSWDNLANTLLRKIKPYALTPQEWSLAIIQLNEGKTFQELVTEAEEKISTLMDSGKDDMDIQVVRWKEKKADYEAKQKLWEGEADSGLEAKKVTEKLQEIKKRLSNVFPEAGAHYSIVRKCAALVHLTSMMDYSSSEYTSPTSGDGGGGTNFNQIQMQMQMAQQLQPGGAGDGAEMQQETMTLEFSCASAGAETQDFPACRKSVSQMRAFQIASQGFNVAAKLKMDADAKRRAQKVKCQAEYIRNPNMEMTVSTDPESPGCAEYIQVQGQNNAQLILKALQEKEKMGTLSEEDQKIMEIQKARIEDYKKRSQNLSVQQLALQAQKEGIEAQQKFQLTKMGFQATKLAVLGNAFSKFPDKGKLHGICKSGLGGNPESVAEKEKERYESWINELVRPYRVFKCAPFNYDVAEFVKGDVHGGGMELVEAPEQEDSGGDGEPPTAMQSKDKTSTRDPCQDVIGGSTVGLLRNQSSREQLKSYLIGIGKDAMVSFMSSMIYKNQADIVQSAMDGTKALEQPFTMTPFMRENLNKLCNGTPIEPKALCDATKNAMNKGPIYPSQLRVSFQGGGATKIAPNKRLKLGVNRRAANVKAATSNDNVDAIGSGLDMGGGGGDESQGEPQAMQGLGEVASSEGGSGGDAGGPGLMEGGGDPEPETQESERGAEAAGLESGELQVAQFQGGGKMAGGGVGMDMGGMVPGSEGGEMSFRGPASGDGGVAGRAKGIFKIISKRYKSIHGRNKLLKYDKKK